MDLLFSNVSNKNISNSSFKGSLRPNFNLKFINSISCCSLISFTERHPIFHRTNTKSSP